MAESSPPTGPTREQFALAVDALRAFLAGDVERARLAVAGLVLDLADERCDGCGRPFASPPEKQDAVARREKGEKGYCTDCLFAERWR